MLKCCMPVGIPASGKSSWAKAEVAKDPDNWVRVNNDDLRAMMNGSVWSSDYEKMVTEARNYLIRDAFKRGKNVIVDNLNLNRRHFDDVVKIAKSMNKDIEVFEKLFYIELEEAIERDVKREGNAKVGEVVIRKWWKESGGAQHKFYKPRVEIMTRDLNCKDEIFVAANQDETLSHAIISDLDGTLALFVGKRSPYDAAKCADDDLNEPVAETIKLYAAAGHKIIFCSGREDKYRDQTIQFIEKHLPGLEYELFMRKSGDMRKDSIVKEEIYRGKIEDKYFVKFVLDDRDQVVALWRELGLTCFQVAPGNF